MYLIIYYQDRVVQKVNVVPEKLMENELVDIVDISDTTNPLIWTGEEWVPV